MSKRNAFWKGINCQKAKNILLPLLLLAGIVYPSYSYSQWNSDISQNTPVCTEINNQNDYSIASDTKGGVYIIWTDKRANIIRSDIYVQRFNSGGYELWNHQGIGVCITNADKANPSTVEDGYGGVIVAWDDSLNNDRDIYAQRIDSTGNPLWTVNGVPVVVKPNKQKDVKIISDGAGGAIAVWEDSSAGYWDIYAQRISSSGNILWATNGVPVCAAILNQKNPRIVADGFGGAYITWQDKRNGVDYDIYAQHLNSSGNALWTVDGIPVCAIIEKQTDPKIVSDGLGGAIVAWQDKRGGLSYDVYAQRINSSGVLQWTSNGNIVCNADSSQTSVDLTSDNITGAIITWRDKRNGLYHDIYAQKINLNGTVAWQNNGIKVTNALLTQTNPNICGDGLGGAIIAWQDSTNNNWDIRSQRINSNGNMLWNSGGNLVSNAVNTQTGPKNISDGEGGSIYVWKDFRNGLHDDIYAQHLTANGVESVFSSPYNSLLNVNVYPNPMNETAMIEIYDENNVNKKMTGLIYDIYGRKIKEINIDKCQILINVKEISNGIYFLTLMENDKVVSNSKIIIER